MKNLINKTRDLVSQRWFENTFILALSIGFYTYAMSEIPPKLHHFEEWIDMQFRFLNGTWAEFWREYSQFGTNDTNAAVRSPIWLILVYISGKFFNDIVLAHRVPSVFLTAFIPLLMTEITRRFYRKDMALFVGLAAVGSQHFMFLGRIGGYVAPTTTLFLLIMLCAMSIAWEDSRRAWVPLLLCFMIMPMMYSTIRYMSLMAPLIIGVEFIRSANFRRRHTLPIIACTVALLAYWSIFVRESLTITAVDFFRARGEQHLLTSEMIRANEAAAQVSLIDRMLTVLRTTGVENLEKVVPTYWSGQRFFDWYYQNYQFDLHKYLARLFVFGSCIAAIKMFWQPRYGVWLIWSLLGWVPLLVTTGLTNNRMLNGLPADLFLIVLGLMVPYDILAKLFGPKLLVIPKVLMIGVLAYYIHFSFERLIVDCLSQCR